MIPFCRLLPKPRSLRLHSKFPCCHDSWLTRSKRHLCEAEPRQKSKMVQTREELEKKQEDRYAMGESPVIPSARAS
jgi:hypothetical protein